jgi:Flp pilus assembly CpaF family ATPase
VKQAIKRLFGKGHFDICIVREVSEIVGARRGGDAYKMLRALHCVDYASMEPELRARLPELVNECLRQQDNVIEATEVALKGIV